MAQSPLILHVRRAILRLGEDAPPSLDDETQISDLADEFAVPALDQTLCDWDWNFASHYANAEAADVNDVPLIKWANKYKFPADPFLVALREVYQGVEKLKKDLDFEIAGRFLLTNGASIAYRYTFREDNPNNWAPGFSSVYEAKLREVLAFPVTTDRQIEISAEAAYIRTLGRATGQNEAEGGAKKTNYDGISSVLDD